MMDLRRVFSARSLPQDFSASATRQTFGVRRARELCSESQRGGTSGYTTKDRSGAIFETRSRVLGTKIWLSIWWLRIDWNFAICDGHDETVEILDLSLCFCHRIRTTSCLGLFFSFFFPFLFCLFLSPRCWTTRHLVILVEMAQMFIILALLLISFLPTIFY